LVDVGSLSRTKHFQGYAAAVLNALFAALDDEEHCKYILEGKHITQLATNRDASGCKGDPNLSSQALIRALDSHLPAQLTAVACLARLCVVEINVRSGVHDSSADPGPYCTAALDGAIYGVVFKSIYLALQVGLHVSTSV